MNAKLDAANAAVATLIRAAADFARAHMELAPDDALERLATCPEITIAIRVQPTLAVMVCGRSDTDALQIEVPIELEHGALN